MGELISDLHICQCTYSSQSTKPRNHPLLSSQCALYTPIEEKGEQNVSLK